MKVKIFAFINGILFFCLTCFCYAGNFKETKGQVKNLAHYKTADLKVQIKWTCLENIIHPHTCGKAEQEVRLNEDGSFLIPAFTTPSLDSFQWSYFSYFLKTPDQVLAIVDSQDSAWSKKLKIITLAEVKGLSVSATLKSGKNINQWIHDVAPRGYLEVMTYIQGGSVKNNQFYSTKIKSFPFEIPNQYFVFTSLNPQDNHLYINYKITTSLYDTGGFGTTELYEITYTGPHNFEALQEYKHIEIDPALINTDITGSWSGVLLTNSEYNVEQKMALSNPHVTATLKCDKNILSGEIQLHYDNEYDQPNFSKAATVTGVCNMKDGHGETTLTFKEYLGTTLIDKKVRIITEAISTKTLNMNIYDVSSHALLGGFRLGR